MLRCEIWFQNKITVQNKIPFQVDFLRMATTLNAKRLHFKDSKTNTLIAYSKLEISTVYPF